MSSTYDFVSSGVGNYKFEPLNRFHYVSSTGDLTEIFADHQPVNMKISGLLSKPVEAAGANQKRSKFESCSDDQQKGIKKAIEMAQSSALDTSGYAHCRILWQA